MQNSTSTKGSISTPACDCDPCKAIRRLERAFRGGTLMLGLLAFVTGWFFVNFLLSLAIAPLAVYMQMLSIGTILAVAATWFTYSRWTQIKRVLLEVMKAKQQHMLDAIKEAVAK
jgi:hypothetical protein